jgi:glycosyltransferase involved in cell wall biosynthesis
MAVNTTASAPPAAPATLPLIVNCSDTPYTFLAPHFAGQTRWKFYNCTDAWRIERMIPKPDLARIRTCFTAALHAKRHNAAVFISHGPRIASWSEKFLRMLGFRGKHIAFSFNFTDLPHGYKRRMMAKSFRTIDRFAVFSTMEKHLYHEALGIPLEKIDFMHWAVQPPEVSDAEPPVEPGDYICALGGNARDYPTLMAAMEQLPAIKLVIVVRPHNLKGLTIPPNVKVYTDLDLHRTMNVLKHSRFMVLPLAGSEVPCGHVTLVSAMHLGKAFVITNSKGVQDYVQDGTTSITCEAKSVDAMVGAIRKLYEDQEFCNRLGRQGAAFAARDCSEPSTLAYVKNYFEKVGVL